MDSPLIHIISFRYWSRAIEREREKKRERERERVKEKKK